MHCLFYGFIHVLFVLGFDAVSTEPHPDVLHHGVAVRPRQTKAVRAEISCANSGRLGGLTGTH